MIVNSVCLGSVVEQPLAAFQDLMDHKLATAVLEGMIDRLWFLKGRSRSLPSSHTSPKGDALIRMENKMGCWRIHSGATTVAPNVSNARAKNFCSSLRLLSRCKSGG